MLIKILGPGCSRCAALERVTREAVGQLGLKATIEKVEDLATITGYGVMTTPALVVDDQVLMSGRVPTARGIRELLQAAR